MKVIGITGNSGSGKSLVCSILKKNGVYVIDADKIAHSVIYPNGCAYKEVVDEFGEIILGKDNFINRKILGQIVFSNKDKLERLSAIIHKYVIEIILLKIQSIKNSGKYFKAIFIDAPLLIESGLNNYVDEIWVVYASEESRLKRVHQRDNLNTYSIIERFNSQSSFEYLKQHADVVIENTGSIECLVNIVNDLKYRYNG